MHDDEFDRAVEIAAMPHKTRRTYPSTTCPVCGRTIREGAYSSANSNLKKHIAKCEREGSDDHRTRRGRDVH